MHGEEYNVTYVVVLQQAHLKYKISDKLKSKDIE